MPQCPSWRCVIRAYGFWCLTFRNLLTQAAYAHGSFKYAWHPVARERRVDQLMHLPPTPTLQTECLERSGCDLVEELFKKS